MWNSVENNTNALASHTLKRIHEGFVVSVVPSHIYMCTVYTLAIAAFVLRAPCLHYHLTPQPFCGKSAPEETVPRQRRFFWLFFYAGGSIAAFCPLQTSTGHGEALGM